jgi:predicted AAA+ superfamily ATPase
MVIDQPIIMRNTYIDQIRPFIDRPFIKVLTGLRRCGKSSILRLLAFELESRGIPADKIIYINFESLEFIDILSVKALNTYIHEKTTDNDRYYLLLDEIQEVPGWEKVVNSLLVEQRFDMYVTGSNSRLLSSELATYIAGRYIQIKVKTLSFAEYLDFLSVYGKVPMEEFNVDE